MSLSCTDDLQQFYTLRIWQLNRSIVTTYHFLLVNNCITGDNSCIFWETACAKSLHLLQCPYDLILYHSEIMSHVHMTAKYSHLTSIWRPWLAQETLSEFLHNIWSKKSMATRWWSEHHITNTRVWQMDGHMDRQNFLQHIPCCLYSASTICALIYNSTCCFAVLICR